MKKIFLFLPIFLILAACSGNIEPDPTPVDPEKEDGQSTDKEVSDERFAANYFAYNVVSTYYLWCDECADAIKTWQTDDDPVQKVKSMRLKDSSGKDIDKWTEMLEDPDEFIGAVEGTEKTCGFDFSLFWYDSSHTRLVPVVNFVYAGSPAEKAGLKRGDGIMTVNGKQLLSSNYIDIIYDDILGDKTISLELNGGKKVSLTPVEMYEDPVNIYKTFDVAGSKIGYMHYTSFGVSSYPGLTEACSFFKKEGVKTLILDLRYNGGGSVLAEQTLASMLAPESVVQAKKVFLKTIYNKQLTDAWGEESETFETEYDFTYNKKRYAYSIKDAVIGLEHIYVIMNSDSSASASEAVVCGLLPYTDVKVVGTGSHGKYCGGYIMSGRDWYNDNKKYIKEEYYNKGRVAIGTWGIYVMVSKYADCNGNTPCMPNGFSPDVYVEDDPLDGHQLGDPEETMLAAALKAATGTKSSLSREASRASSAMVRAEGKDVRKRGFGIRILPQAEPTR